MTKTTSLLLCDCAGTMRLDADSAGAAVGAERVKTCSRLCTGDVDLAQTALEGDGRVMIACGQEAPRFAELWEALESDARLVTCDIRDRAGWTGDGTAFAKQAALLAEAALEPPEMPVKEVESRGTLLILGSGEAAVHAARRLADVMAVTCLIDGAAEVLAPEPGFDLASGRLVSGSGALGGFSVKVAGFALAEPGGRGAPGFGPARDNVRSECDVILDLRKGAAPLFPAPSKREGYLRADPGDRAAVEAAVFEASQLVGVFEKPIYVRFDPLICAHSRASQTGCSRCLDICPTGAITPSGDHVEIDPDVCAGCGGCAAVCPSGAASYDNPDVGFLFRRLATLADAFRAAGGARPRLLVHDEDFGAELIALSARHGRGLPADVIPFEVYNVEGFGHAEMLAALGVGFAEVMLLTGPRTEMTVPDAQLELARAIVEGTGHAATRLRAIAPSDPDALEATLAGEAPDPAVPQPILPMGGRREVTRLAAAALAGGKTDPIPLPDGAVYGTVEVNTDACTLCLACVSLCPSGAVMDNPDKPQLSVQEAACLQCGICVNTCPEDAISLLPRLNPGADALAPVVLNEEEPFACISCGKPFGVRSTIERIVAKLEGAHPLFTGSNNADLIRMCDDCRVKAQFHSQAAPFAGTSRPPVRTTEHYTKNGGGSDEGEA
ncbi:4Fe-4S dicluster domain-containing protein [Marimonas arenosa]|uniref:4Fe-4S binding protein n=2 Tax=Pseudomonadati TaxID=3379134 RepID=A0AAE3WFP9_9RHOB|nr:4Fe-4S dicluster domain-containing protein [Marimonas arenosa]MDQ2092186.1 4Fe-4S binding protein [Marimonas arenosa]